MKSQGTAQGKSSGTMKGVTDVNGSILNEISILRGREDFSVNLDNTNRHRILTGEKDGTETSYYFSAPIYNIKSKKLVKRGFSKNGNIFQTEGSSAEIAVSKDGITLVNDEAAVSADFCGGKYFSINELTLSDGNLHSEKLDIYPTLNGVAVKVKNAKAAACLRIQTDKPFIKLRTNTKYFALMSGNFNPYMTVSAIGIFDLNGTLYRPAEISCQKTDDRNHTVRISDGISHRPDGSPGPSGAEAIMFEINLCEQVLFQDTTVESRNPGENNAFGGTAFLGNSDFFGRQWLYSRLDAEKVPELLNTEINKIMLHIPKYSGGGRTLTAYGLESRFCSFGSNWENKIRETTAITVSKTAGSNIQDRYCSLDITEFFSDKRTGSFKPSEGMILKQDVNGGDNGFMVLATGDNYYTPQILEVSASRSKF